jgi:hypothetical protein
MSDPTKYEPKFTSTVQTPNQGWECPRCGSVNAPQIEKCKCVKTESVVKDTRQLLTE